MPGTTTPALADVVPRRLTWKRRRLLLALAALSTAVGLGLWCSQRGSLCFRCGLLSSAKDQYLDNTGHVFQKGSWHLGDATHIWGETYGVKLGRVYFTLAVSHVNPNVSADQAGD